MSFSAWLPLGMDPQGTAEKMMITAAIMYRGETLEAIEEFGITPKHITSSEHLRDAMEGILALVDARQIVEELNLYDWLHRMRGDKAGAIMAAALDYVNVMEFQGPLSVRYIAYAAAEREMERATARLSQLVSERAPRQEREKAQDAVNSASRRLDAITVRAEDSGTVAAAKLIGDINRAYELRQEGRHPGISTGFVDLDKLVGGFWPGELTVIGARPSIGKTAMGVTLARNLARHNVPSAFISLEMSTRALLRRMAAADLGIEVHRLRSGDVSAMEKAMIETKVEELRLLPVAWYDDVGTDVADVEPIIRMAVRQRGAKVLFIDYLQLMKSKSRYDKQSRAEEVGEVAQRLHRVTQREGVSIVALAQLNRESEKGADPRPRVVHLRESGGIEQAAANIWLLHRPEYHGVTATADQRPTAGLAEVYIDKHREGATGVVELHYDKARARFGDYTHHLDQQAAPNQLPSDYGNVYEVQPATDENPF